MKVVTIPCSFDNYAYLIIEKESRQAAVVDPAEFYPVYRALEENGVSLQVVFCTHHHADHIGGLAELREEFADLTICGSEFERSRIPGMNCSLTEDSRINIGRIAGRVIATPGHTKGSICYCFGDYIFTGDTLFGGGCGRIFEGTPQEMYDSLMKLKVLPMATRICFGHEYTLQNLKFAGFVEPDNVAITERMAMIKQNRDQSRTVLTTPSTLQLECATNPFLRCGEAALAKTVAENFVIDRLDDFAVFTALRGLKDNY